MSKKTKIIVLSINVLLLILISVCVLKAGSYSRLLLSQQAAEEWAGDSEQAFAQASCFFPTNALKTIDNIYSFRGGLKDQLNSAGLEEPDTGKLWTDAYSGTGSLSVKGQGGTADVTAVGVGGNFFLFHPYELLSGSYISDEDLMQDRVVLDYELAWQLFGSSNLQGMSVTINGTPYYVAGVVRRETDKFSTRVFSDGKPLIFMPYSTLSGLIEGTGISTYEICMANPISGFVSKVVTDKMAGEDSVVVENSSRYSFSKILSMFTDFGERSIIKSGVAYPYWENAARISEVYVARLYTFTAVLAIFPLICLIWILVLLIKMLVSKMRKTKSEVSDAWDDRYARMDQYKQKRAEKKAHGKKKVRGEKKPRGEKKVRSEKKGHAGRHLPKKRRREKLPVGSEE